MLDRKIFISNFSFDDALKKMLNAGYKYAGKGTNKRRQYVVFGRRII